MAGVAEDHDRFGFALAAEDFNGDLQADLAIGVPCEDLPVPDAGAVNALYGSASGLSATVTRADQLWHQDSSNVQDQAEPGDSFGSSLTPRGYWPWPCWGSDWFRGT